MPETIPKRGGESLSVTDGRPSITWVDDLILDYLSPLIKPVGKALYFDLCRYVKEGKKVKVFYETLAERNGIDYDTVRKYIKILDNYGLITKNTPSAKARFKGGEPCEFVINSTEFVKERNKALFAANFKPMPSGGAPVETPEKIESSNVTPVTPEKTLISPSVIKSQLENKGFPAIPENGQVVPPSQLEPATTVTPTTPDSNAGSPSVIPVSQSTTVKPVMYKNTKQCFVPDVLIKSIHEKIIQIKPEILVEELQPHWHKALKLEGSKDGGRQRLTNAFEVMWQAHLDGESFGNPLGWLMKALMHGWKKRPKNSTSNESGKHEKISDQEAAEILEEILPEGQKILTENKSHENFLGGGGYRKPDSNARRHYSQWTREEMLHHNDLAKDSFPKPERLKVLDQLFSSNPLWPFVRNEIIEQPESEKGGG